MHLRNLQAPHVLWVCQRGHWLGGTSLYLRSRRAGQTKWSGIDTSPPHPMLQGGPGVVALVKGMWMAAGPRQSLMHRCMVHKCLAAAAWHMQQRILVMHSSAGREAQINGHDSCAEPGWCSRWWMGPTSLNWHCS